MKRIVFAVCLVLLVACRREPAPAPVPPADAVAPGPGSPPERRAPRPAVIGGCALACSTPEAAVSYFFTQLQHQDPVTALRPSFEWSLLVVDGDALGSRWADLWADPHQHAARDQQIDQWLLDWTAWLQRIDDPAGLGHARSTGIRLQHPNGVKDRVLVSFRHPHLHNDRTDPIWQMEWTLRGDEWLVSRIEHRPSGNPGR